MRQPAGTGYSGMLDQPQRYGVCPVTAGTLILFVTAAMLVQTIRPIYSISSVRSIFSSFSPDITTAYPGVWFTVLDRNHVTKVLTLYTQLILPEAGAKRESHHLLVVPNKYQQLICQSSSRFVQLNCKLSITPVDTFHF